VPGARASAELPLHHIPHIPELWIQPDAHCSLAVFLLKSLGKMLFYIRKKTGPQTFANSAH